MSSYLADGNFYDALRLYADKCVYYMKRGVTYDEPVYKPGREPNALAKKIFPFCVSGYLAAIFTAIFEFINSKKLKSATRQKTAREYLPKDSLNLVERREDLVRT